MKIDEQGCGVPGTFEICKHGGYVNSFDSLNGFEFNNHGILNDQIHSVADLHWSALVDQWQSLLSLEGQPGFTELMAEAGFVARFEQAGTELAVHPNGGTNDRARNTADIHSECSVCSVVNNPFEGCTETNPETMTDRALFMSLRDL